jgi:hypothetical protein
MTTSCIKLIETIAPYIVAIIGVLSPMFTAKYFKNLELEKHKQEIILNKKIEIYKELYSKLVTINAFHFTFIKKENWKLHSSNEQLIYFKSLMPSEDEIKKFNTSSTEHRYLTYQQKLNLNIYNHMATSCNDLNRYYIINKLFLSENIEKKIKKLLQSISNYVDYILNDPNRNFPPNMEESLYSIIDECEKILKDELRSP